MSAHYYSHCACCGALFQECDCGNFNFCPGCGCCDDHCSCAEEEDDEVEIMYYEVEDADEAS